MQSAIHARRKATPLESPRRSGHILAEQPESHFTVKGDEGCFGPSFPDGVDELYCVVPSVIKDIERLKLSYPLFAETLDQLCCMGSTYNEAPNVPT